MANRSPKRKSKAKKKSKPKGKEKKKGPAKIGPGRRPNPEKLGAARKEEVVRLGSLVGSATQRVKECQSEVDRAKEALASKRGIFMDAQENLTEICTEIEAVYSGEFQPPLPGMKKPAGKKKRKGKK